MKFIADTHTHSLASGHAYSTIREMASAAADKGLKMLALTEHAPELPGTCGLYYFMNFDVIPRKLYGVEMLFGAEVNIMNPEGKLDLPHKVYQDLDIVIASIHPPCYGMGHSIEENTQAYVNVMKNPYVNIIGHPDDGRFPVDYEVLVKTAKETGTLLELNNSSLRPASFREGGRENMKIMLDLCKKYEVMVTTGSDAHVDADVGRFCYVQEMLDFCNFPEELIVTTDIEKLKLYLNRFKK
ncbi:MAG: phosphatase [Schaedlerella sp.]|nr:phosphatase [Schaedlerella sp.]